MGSPVDLHSLRELALDAAGQAAVLLVDKRPDRVDVAATKSSPTDVVTEMDRSAERLIVNLIKETRPDDSVLAEEGSADTGTTRVRWLVDPIDGTVNYLYGLPGWSVSIGIEVDGDLAVGVVAVPTFGETYTAVLGEGAYRDDERIRCNRPPDLGYALVGTGFGYEIARRAHQADVVRGCCRGCGTSGGSVRAPPTCARSPAAGWTPTMSAAHSPGTSLLVC